MNSGRKQKHHRQILTHHSDKIFGIYSLKLKIIEGCAKLLWSHDIGGINCI